MSGFFENLFEKRFSNFPKTFKAWDKLNQSVNFQALLGRKA
jgi:hypothetical protein